MSKFVSSRPESQNGSATPSPRRACSRAHRRRGRRSTRSTASTSCSSPIACRIPATREPSCAARWPSGAGAITLGAGSVDAYNPKVVRATAGALFAVPIIEGSPTRGGARAARRRAGCAGSRAVAHGGDPARRSSIFPARSRSSSGTRSTDSERCPSTRRSRSRWRRAAESLNVAMAATVLCFEAQRQRRPRAWGRHVTTDESGSLADARRDDRAATAPRPRRRARPCAARRGRAHSTSASAPTLFDVREAIKTAPVAERKVIGRAVNEAREAIEAALAAAP